MKCGPKMGKMSFDKELCTYVLVHCNVNVKLFVCGDFSELHMFGLYSTTNDSNA